jgi:hypothetical protein
MARQFARPETEMQTASFSANYAMRLIVSHYFSAANILIQKLIHYSKTLKRDYILCNLDCF